MFNIEIKTMPLQHPLAVNTRIVAHQPQCACMGAKFKVIEGTVKQVFNYPSGYWYYLDTGGTVSAQWVQQVK